MHAKKTNKTKLAVVLLALALLVGCAAGATLAWLKVETAPIVNTFTVGDIDIKLTETGADANNKQSFKMVPGSDIAKDPTVTVLKDSEACYLFVKVEKSENFDKFMSYGMATGWTPLDATNHPGVYYRSVGASTADQPFYVLAADTAGENAKGSVHVLDTVTKADMNNLTASTYPTLTFTAYAVQSANVADAAAAWKIANP